MEEEKIENSFKGSVVKRLFAYLKPYKLQIVIILLLVFGITALELYRPILIGNAIDDYIEGYNKPYGVVNNQGLDTIEFDNKQLSYHASDALTFYQLVLYKDQYYLFRDIDKATSEFLSKMDIEIVSSINKSQNSINLSFNNQVISGQLMSESELKTFRQLDFVGIRNVAYVYVGVLALLFIANMLQTWLLQLVGQKTIYAIRNQLFQHVHTLPLRYFDTHPVGQIVTRITNDVETLNEMYSSILVRLFNNCIKIIGLALVMMSINLKMSLYAFLLLPIIVVLTFIFKKISRAMYRVARTRISILNTFLSENISGMKLIQIFARENKKYMDFEERNTKLYQANFKELIVSAVFRPLIYMISIFALQITIYNGANLVLTNIISMGTLYIFINYIGTFYEPIQELAEQFSTLQNALASAEKIFTIMDEESTIKEVDNPQGLLKPVGKIEFKNVWFAYEEEYVLRDISFVINPGEKVAFVGATGAGKSSILNLIGRYYDIQKGQILIDDIDIKELKLSDLRKAIGQVQQDVFIFTGDIASNIRLLDNSISDEEIERVAHFVNANSFIEAMPNKYHESVSERGSTLSAGQRQLLSFARTLAYDPKILVMDEATANIDTQTESLIQEALANLMHSRTTIMVAHRLSTIQHADKIIVMHKGKIREMGNHQALLKQEGIYKKLYELQLKMN